MCRLFGFRSVIPSQVHRSLLEAENALGTQSNAHPDGWGVAFYVDGVPHVTRSPLTALGDQLFHRLSGVVSSQTVLAHVRKATQGQSTLLNCHPFQYGRWVFAHNGDVPNLSLVHEQLRAQIAPPLRRFVLGETDSELIFYILISELRAGGPLDRPRSASDVMEAVRRTTQAVRQVCDGKTGPGQDGQEETCLLTMMVTDGQTLVAVQGGKELFLSTYKTRCADRQSCPSLAPECEAPSRTGFVNHCIVSSERLSGENVWEELGCGHMIGVDWRMQLLRGSLDRGPVLPIAE